MGGRRRRERRRGQETVDAAALQAKLEVNAPDDEYEREADAVADKVTRMPPQRLASNGAGGSGMTLVAGGTLSRKPSDELGGSAAALTAPAGPSLQREEDEEDANEVGTLQLLQREADEEDDASAEMSRPLQREAMTDDDEPGESPALQRRAAGRRHERPQVTGAFESSLRRLRQSGGQPLPSELLGYMEARFGRDFGQVRSHSGPEAALLARQVRARAFTVGHDIVFGEGQLRPREPDGRRLVAHELTHVLQQQGGLHRVQRELEAEPDRPKVPSLSELRTLFALDDAAVPKPVLDIVADLLERVLAVGSAAEALAVFIDKNVNATTVKRTLESSRYRVELRSDQEDSGRTLQWVLRRVESNEAVFGREHTRAEPTDTAPSAEADEDTISVPTPLGTSPDQDTTMVEAAPDLAEVPPEAVVAETAGPEVAATPPGEASASESLAEARAQADDSAASTGEAAQVGLDEEVPAGEEPAAEAPAEAPMVEPQMPPPPEELGPAAQQRLGSARGAAGSRASAESTLPSAEASTGEARAAVTEPPEEQLAEARADLVAALEQRPEPSPEIEALCQRIYQAIRDRRPPDEDSLLEADPTSAARQAGGELNDSIQSDADRVEGEYAGLDEAPPTEAAVPGTPLETPPTEVESRDIDAEGAAPDPVPDADIDLGADVENSAQQMADAGMETEPAQLVQSGPIAEAREAHGELSETAERDPAEVIAEQQAAIERAQGDMAQLQAQALAAMNSSREGTIEGSGTQQTTMVGSEEEMRRAASGRADELFTSAQGRVRGLLEPLARTAMATWDAELPRLSREFRSSLDRVQDWIDERHSGAGGAVLSVVDYALGYPDWVVDEYDRAEREFGDGVCDVIRDISRDVNAVIAAAEAIIAEARRQIDEVFASLPAELQGWAEEQRQGFSARLDSLQEETQQARDDFNRDLTQRAAGAVQEVRQEIHELREAAGGLLGRIASAIEAFLDDPVRFIINGLLELVGIEPSAFWALVDRLGEVVSGIADDPLGFANNLLEALAQGFTQFFDNIGAHLLQGLLDWLFSGLGSVGVQLPPDFSLSSIVTFFLQLMGLTWDNIREILARHIGEENVALLERAYEIIQVLIEQGPSGIIEMIREQLDPSVILQTVMDAAIEMVIEALITQATVRILGMLNPAGAVLQAIEAIYRVVKWVFENAARIFTLVETIVNGAYDIMNGNIGGMANAVETALAGLIPPVIDFLAGFVGLGDLPERIAGVIRDLQGWVLGIVDRVVGFIAAQARRVLAALGIGGGDEEGEEELEDMEERTTMSGETHTVTVDLEQHHVMMASEREDEIATKAATARSQLASLRDSDPAKATDAEQKLDAINLKASQIVAAIPNPTDANKDARLAEIRSLTDQVLVLLRDYGETFGVHSLLEPIPAYPPAELGLHPMNSEKSAHPSPDGIPRESHHVPANELAQSLSEALDGVIADLHDEPTAAAAIGPLSRRTVPTLDASGDDLPAILLHQTTHRTGSTAVHRAHMRELVERKIAELHRGAEARRASSMEQANQEVDRAASDIDVRTGSGRLAMNPQGRHWQSFIQQARAAALQLRAAGLAEATTPEVQESVEGEIAEAMSAISTTENTCREESDAEEATIDREVETEVSMAIEIAYTAGLTQAVAAVLAALDASVVDGPKAEQPSEAELRRNADNNPLWKKLRGRG
ncbi:eCIS core domain-containing protein [Paraliomyxa miuraensis]|uniref:eCIS core domain-containing protein n=1 Tax=Paraliomyxa miuraensis TaxID=376150 RepID=UPI002257AD99|nr:DUF4157 domain-containing protein [Paraliomyxa miuraensis]MCX4245562.1 DUF4157 domain-containing protein [Paraliomyxa miuraensis]